MSIRKANEALVLFNQTVSDGDVDTDEKQVAAHAASLSPDRAQRLLEQLRALATDPNLCSLDELGTEANRWFGDAEEARAWLQMIYAAVEAEVERQGPKGTTPDGDQPRDSNGALLSEGDSVIVIKDLKVKGGSSDLKRGTLIKKIHLIGDPQNIECRVDGSTLVLKTMFLRKA
jgi:protein PhnA